MSHEIKRSEEFRKVEVVVTSQKVGKAFVTPFNWESGHIQVYYRVPLYKVFIKGFTDSRVHKSAEFKAIRFGMWYRTNNRNNHIVVGKEEQSISTLIYGRQYQGTGCFRLSAYKQVLIHKGPDNPLRKRRLGALGCIEISGPGEWDRFKNAVRELAGTRNLRKYGFTGKLTCRMQYAKMPARTKA